MSRLRLALASAALVCLSQTLAAEQPPPIEFLNSGKVLPRNLPFSELVRHGNTLYLSGQIGIQPGTTKIVPGGVREEARQTMENIKTSLEAHGYSLGNLVKCTVMLADIADWPAFNEVYKGFFSSDYPARSAFGASGLALGARVEVDCIGAVGERCCQAKPGRY
jgi:2-iminobutanoate/2-iminopropanoate deaminase